MIGYDHQYRQGPQPIDLWTIGLAVWGSEQQRVKESTAYGAQPANNHGIDAWLEW